MEATSYDLFNSVWSTDPRRNKGDLHKETEVTEQGHGSINNSSTPSSSILQSQNPLLQNHSKNDLTEGNINMSFRNNHSYCTCHLPSTSEQSSPRNDPLKAIDQGSISSSQESNQVSTNNSSTALSSSLQPQNPFLNYSKNDITEGNNTKSFKNSDSSSTCHLSFRAEPLSPGNDTLKATDHGSKTSSQEPNQISTNNSSTPSSSSPSQNSLQKNGSNNSVIEGNNKSFKNSDSSSTCHILSTSEPSSPRNDPLEATNQGPKSSSQEPNQVSTNATKEKTNIEISDSSDNDDDDDDDDAQPASSVAASNDELGSKNKGLELEIQKPAVQVMERPELSIDTSSSYVFPPHVFAKNTTNAQADWSLASNESLFSIHMGNMSFSHELACLSRNDFWIDTPLASPLASPSQPQPPPLPLQTPSKFNDISQRAAEIHEESAGVSEIAIETMREVIMETSQNKPNATKRGKKNKNTPVVAAVTASQLSTDQDENVASKGTDENADKSVASNGAKGKQQQQQQQQQQASNAFYQSPKPMKASRDAEEENQKELEAPNKSSNPSTTNNPPKAGGGGGWLSCFLCCCR